MIEHDETEIEKALEALGPFLALPLALRPPELQAEFEKLIDSAVSCLSELSELGLIRLYWDADGSIAAEFLRRVEH
jgi:hypothetical protein